MGRVVRGISKAVGNIAKGVVKFAKSPIGKALIGVGLSVFTGGAGGLLAGGLKGVLSGGLKSIMSGGLGNLGQIFSGVAKNFLPNISSMLSGSGLSTVTNFLQSSVLGGKGSGGLADIAGSLARNFLANKAQQPDPVTQQAGYENLQQLLAYFQAQVLRQQQTTQSVAV